MGRVRWSEHLGDAAPAVAGLGFAALLGLFLLVWKNPAAPMLLIGGAGAACIGLLLLDRPVAALHGAIVLMLLPMGLRVDTLHSLAVNGLLLGALVSWLLGGALRGVPVHRDATSLLAALYIAWAIVSLVWAPDVVEGRREIVAWIIGFLFLFLLVQQTRSLPDVDGLMRLLAGFGWFLVLAGIYTVLLTGYDPARRLKVLDMNENLYGIMLIVTLPGVLWLGLRARGTGRAVWMTLGVAYVLASLGLIAASGSRGSALSLVAILLAFLFSRPVRPWGFIGLGLIVAMLALAPFVLDTLIHRFTEGEGEGDLGGRDRLWEASLMLLRDAPWTGVGIGNGPFELHDYIAALTSAANHRRDLPSHQPFLEIGVETGLFGLLIYAGIILSAVWSFVRSRPLWRAAGGAAAAYHPIVGGVAVGYALSWFKAGGMENHVSFFVLLALLAVPGQIARNAAAGGLSRQPALGGRTGSPR